LDIDHPTPSPEPEAQVSSLPRSPSPQAPSIDSQPLSQPTQLSLNEWSSPAFLKRARGSLGSLVGSSYDPFADLDGFIEGKGRKRTRFWRDSGQWRYMDRTPSPEKEILASPEDAMDMDEEALDGVSNLDGCKPMTEGQASEGLAPGGCEELAQAKEIGLGVENELVYTEPILENLPQLGAKAAGSRGKEPHVQRSDSNLEVANSMGGTVLSSPEPVEPTSPPPTDYTAQLESSDIHTTPHMPRPPVAPLQTGAAGAGSGGEKFDSQETPSSPILRPVPSPSLPAVSPFSSSWTETTDYFDPIQTQTLPGSGEASERGRTDGDGLPDSKIDHLDVEKGELYPLTSQPTIWTSDPNTGEHLEPGMDELEVAGAGPANLPYAVQYATMAESGGSGGEQGSLHTHENRIRDNIEEMDNKMDGGSESETDEFEDDEREELYSAIIPQLRQIATANALDERELQMGNYIEGQGDLHSSISPKVSQEVGTDVGGKNVSVSEDSDSDDLQSVSQDDQASDVEVDEETESDEEQYDGYVEGYGDDSEKDESEGDEGESHSSSPTPVPQKGAMTQEVEVIDLISDDEDEPQQGAQSGIVATQTSRFGLDGTVMSSLALKPKADTFVDQWDKVLAARNESRSEWRTFEEEAGKNVVHETEVKRDEFIISQVGVDQGEGVSSQVRAGTHEIEQMGLNESEGGGLGEIECHALETNHGTNRMETLRGGEPKTDGATKTPASGEAQSARGSATGTPSMADDLSGTEMIKAPDTENNEGRDSTSTRVDTWPFDHRAEECGAPNSEGDPQKLQHRLLDPTHPDLTVAQLQSEYSQPLHQKLGSGDTAAPGIEILYPARSMVQTGEYSHPPSFVAEPYSQIPKAAFDEESGLQLPTPDETQRTLVSQLSASSEHLDAHTTLDMMNQSLPNRTSLTPTPQTNPAPTAPQGIPKSPLSFTPSPSQGQPPFSPPASQLDNTSSQLLVSPVQESQATHLTLQQTRIASLEPPETPTSSQVGLLHKLREIKSASGKRQREGRNVVPGVISPWFTTTVVNQSGTDTEDNQRPPYSTRASPPLADGEQAPLPQNGHALRSPSPTVDAVGITTSLSYFSLLSTLQTLFSQVVDVLAIVTGHQPTAKARRGSRYILSLAITDPSISSSINVTILRPFETALPVVSDGDGILLRGFKVTSQKRKLLLQSTDVSSWAVFKSDGEVEVRGPPVEYGQGEVRGIETLKRWWQGLEVQERGEVAARTQDEQDTANEPRSEPTGIP
jgi:Telomeric single stranded DNA binding POT1/CDC13